MAFTSFAGGKQFVRKGGFPLNGVRLKLEKIGVGKPLPSTIHVKVGIGGNLASKLGLQDKGRVDFGWDLPDSPSLMLKTTDKGYSIRKVTEHMWEFKMTIGREYIEQIIPAGTVELTVTDGVEVDSGFLMVPFTPQNTKR
jgi:hypothetical protein